MSFAQNAGLALQVNEGSAVPAASLFQQFDPRSFRDVLGWHRVEQKAGVYALPADDAAMYALGVPNIVTLYGGNTLYGMKEADIALGAEQITAFCNYAFWVARNVPNLQAISIWNEMNGTFDGGVKEVSARQVALANLTNAVALAIHSANPAVKIIAGASVGWNIDGWFKNLALAGMDFSKVDYLDAHPYIASQTGAVNWANKIREIRKVGLTAPFWFTEWGAGYSPVQWFLDEIVAADSVPVAGGNYFTLQDSAKFPGAGLLDESGTITAQGTEYIAAFG